MHWSCYPPSVVLRQHLLTICGRTSSLSVQMHLRQPLFAAFCAILNNRKSYVWSVWRVKTWNNQLFVQSLALISSKGWAGEPHPKKDSQRVWGCVWVLFNEVGRFISYSSFAQIKHDLVSVFYVYLNLNKWNWQFVLEIYTSHCFALLSYSPDSHRPMSQIYPIYEPNWESWNFFFYNMICCSKRVDAE